MIPSRIRSSSALVAGLAALAMGCGDAEVIDPAPLGGPYPQKLSAYGFFDGPMASLAPAAGVVPFEVAAPLWSDRAGKSRMLALPEGQGIGLSVDGDWDVPVGAVLIKTFWFADELSAPTGPRRIVETRLLLHEADGWTGQVYLWNDEQTDAERAVAGRRIQVSYTVDGVPEEHEYAIPNTNQCTSCHSRDDVGKPLGLITPQMNREVERDGAAVNQLEWLGKKGVFRDAVPDPTSLPAFVDPFGDAPVDQRARSYLHANCSHCHRPGGNGGNSGLELLYTETDPHHYGVCKRTAAAGAGTGGKTYDIVPGDADASIMPFRMGDLDPEVKMPELPNRLPDDEGIALIRAWIAQMTFPACDAPTP